MISSGSHPSSPNMDEMVNARAIEDMVLLLQSNRAICLVGTGLSSAPPLSYPRWRELLNRFEDFAVHKCYCNISAVHTLRSENLKEWAQGLRGIVENARTGSYEEFINKTFGPKNPSYTPTHEALVQLPFQHFLTTNYDPALEYADWSVNGTRDNFIIWKDRRGIAKLLRSLDLPTTERKILHIHGRFNQIDSIVLCSTEYKDCYEDRDDKYMQKAMWGFLSMKSLVFFGFGFNDDDEYTTIVDHSHASFQQFNPNHFAFVGIDEDDYKDDAKRKDKRRFFNNKFGIEPIFYLVVKKDHAALHNALQQIAVRCQPKKIVGTDLDHRLDHDRVQLDSGGQRVGHFARLSIRAILARIIESLRWKETRESDDLILRKRMQEKFDYEKRRQI